MDGWGLPRDLVVGVCDPVPAYRAGVVDILVRDGIPAEEAPTLEEWAAGQQRYALVVGDGTEELSECVIERALATVVLIRRRDSAAYLEALSKGATVGMPWDSSPEMIVEGLKFALVGYGVMPAELLRRAIPTAAHQPEVLSLGGEEMNHLVRLASGLTVAQLASESGYSEREMFRILRRVYDQLGVTGRTEALMKIAALGMLDSRAMVEESVRPERERESPDIKMALS